MRKLSFLTIMALAISFSAAVIGYASENPGSVQRIFCEGYEGQELPHYCRQSFWDENGFLLATKEYMAVAEDGAVNYEWPLEYYIDHFQLTGRIDEYAYDTPETVEITHGDEKISAKAGGMKLWKQADPMYPAYYLHILSENERITDKLIVRQELIFDPDGRPLALLGFDDCGGLNCVEWGEGLADVWKSEEEIEVDEAGNMIITNTLPFSVSVSGNDEFASRKCVSIHTYNPQGNILEYSYSGFNSLEEIGTALQIKSTYEYDANEKLTARHMTKNDISIDTWYDSEGRVYKAAVSGKGVYLYFYDDSGEIEDIYLDMDGSLSEYPETQDTERIKERLIQGVEEGNILNCHFDAEKHSIQSASPDSLIHIEETYSAHHLAETIHKTMRNKENEECDIETSLEYMCDDLRIPVAIEMSKYRIWKADNKTENLESDHTLIYEVRDNEENGKKEYYKEGVLQYAVWSEPGNWSDAVFNLDID